MYKTQSNSGGQSLPLHMKIEEWVKLFGLAALYPSDSGSALKAVHEYEEYYRAHGGSRIATARVLEIGYGARPYRLLAMMGLGLDCAGIDLDNPALRGLRPNWPRILRENGTERFIKSFVRYHTVDRRDYRRFTELLLAAGGSLEFDYARLVVGDACEPEAWESLPWQEVDLIISEDVFEHIPEVHLPSLLRQMQERMSAGGLALIRPNVFTGITGGHDPNWYHGVLDRARRSGSQAWGHLLAEARHANTYLNRLSRGDFRNLFCRYFEIIEEVVADPRLGEAYMTPQLREQLAMWSDDELYSNRVMWVLRKR